MRYQFENIKLAIFDLDGTLINSTSLWKEIDKTFFQKRGMETPLNYDKEIAHLGLEKAAILTSEKFFPNEKPEDIKEEWVNMAKEAYRNHITIKDGAYEILDYLKARNVHLALATANDKDIYMPCVERLHLDQYFEIIADIKQCKNGKNTTEIYDKIAAKLNINKEDVIIFEDLLTPLKVAYLSGYKTIGVYDKYSVLDEKENKKYSTIYIHSFKELL